MPPRKAKRTTVKKSPSSRPTKKVKTGATAKKKTTTRKRAPARKRATSSVEKTPKVRKPAMAAAQRLGADTLSSRLSVAQAPQVRVSAPIKAYGSVAMTLVMLAMVGGFVVTAVRAATFEPPTAAPPLGNIPATIWNSTASGQKQQDSTIDIDGSASLGADDLVLGGTENLLYGNVDATSTGNLLLLETEDTGVWTPRLSVDIDGNIIASGAATSESVSIGSDAVVFGPTENLLYGNMDTTSTGSLLLLQKESADRFRVDGDGNVTAAGKVSASGCFGASFLGSTFSGGPGGDGSYPIASLGSYYAANNKCAIDYPGAHVCTVNEMLESIRCSVPTHAIRTQISGGKPSQAWLNGGPPGFTADANDCFGWTSSAATSYGRFWWFNDTTGGYGTMTSCNSGGLPMACCR